MPVPVPRTVKPPAHPVHKPQPPANFGYSSQGLYREHPAARLLHGGEAVSTISLNTFPTNAAARDAWIASMTSNCNPQDAAMGAERSWNQAQNHLIGMQQQDQQPPFSNGLVGTANVPAIKGALAQASNPPLQQQALVTHAHNIHALHEAMRFEQENNCSVDSMPYLDNQSQWSASSPTDRDMYPEYNMSTNRYGDNVNVIPVYDAGPPELVQGYDVGSSPIGPTTPFGDFVDRALAMQMNPDISPAAYAEQAQATRSYGPSIATLLAKRALDESMSIAAPVVDTARKAANRTVVDKPPTSAYERIAVSWSVTAPLAAEAARKVARDDGAAKPYTKDKPPAQASSSDPQYAPAAIAAYRKLAEPLSDWLAEYIWKVCTTGYNLPEHFVEVNHGPARHPEKTPSYLAPAIHCVLQATFLQPSSIFLAVWYIVHLPVQFDATNMDPSRTWEHKFRLTLLGLRPAAGREALELHAPFKLFVLGCMLANKWLDDHTFSNKTWHTVANLPIETLNRLESVALAIFRHDLSISSREWSQWMSYVDSYHAGLVPPTQHPKPISRPSSTPHSIIKQSIAEIIEISALTSTAVGAQPIFIGLEKRRNDKYPVEDVSDIDMLDIDLDEDGPLRDEYLPKRRVSRSDSVRSSAAAYQEKVITLPPPAKWSPAADEPIFPQRNTGGQYIAVQPSYGTGTAAVQSAYPHIAQRQVWTEALVRNEPPALEYGNAMRWAGPGHRVTQLQSNVGHARSYSLSSAQDQQTENRMRDSTAFPHANIDGLQYKPGGQSAWDAGYSWFLQNINVGGYGHSIASHAHAHLNHFGPLLRV